MDMKSEKLYIIRTITVIMTLLGIKYDSRWRNQPVIVKSENGFLSISNYGECETSSQMFESILRKRVYAKEVERDIGGKGHIFNHLGISVDLNIKIGEKTYKILAKKGNDKVTLISGYVEANDLSDIVKATHEEITEELLIRTKEGLLLSGKKRNSNKKICDLKRAYGDEETDLGYGKFVQSEHAEFQGYSQGLHYLLTPSKSEQYLKIEINEIKIPRNFEIYVDGRTNGIQLDEKLKIELMPTTKSSKGKSNLRFIKNVELSFHHAEDKRIKKDEELHTFFHPCGIILAELIKRYKSSINPERLNGVFYIVENGEIKLTESPKMLSERFSDMSPIGFVESDITLEEYLHSN